MDGAWNGEPYEFDLTRVLRQGTDGDMSARYGSLNTSEATELLAFPALFAYEGASSDDAQLGSLTRVRRRNTRVRLDYALDPNLPTIPAATLQRLAWDLEIEPWEMARTHWALKAVSLMPALAEAKLVTEAQIARLPGPVARPTRAGAQTPLVVVPEVFDVVDQTRQLDLVAVMMPFDAAFDPVHTAVQSACTAAGLQCRRVDGVWQESEIIQDVFTLLFRSAVVLVDFTGRNPNVMYETGIAHTLGRPVVPITQSPSDVPFDLRHHRFLKYLPNREGLADMVGPLSERLRTLTASSRR